MSWNLWQIQFIWILLDLRKPSGSLAREDRKDNPKDFGSKNKVSEENLEDGENKNEEEEEGSYF
jgi:hypothetical protein